MSKCLISKKKFPTTNIWKLNKIKLIFENKEGKNTVSYNI